MKDKGCEKQGGTGGMIKNGERNVRITVVIESLEKVSGACIFLSTETSLD
jgi:hypothetical protein